MGEKRNRIRRRTDALLCVYDRNTDEFVGCLVDMTSDGLKLKSPAEIEANAIFQFRMDLPQELKGSDRITFDARSVWLSQDEVSQEYYTCFQMQGVSSEDIDRIEHLIGGSLFADADERVRVTLSKKTSK
ncbi:MAG: PilZ domain-containing protein [Candidatus Zixiibacteriota bacterium]